MKNTVVRCPYCGSAAIKKPASFVYGENAKPGAYLYVCTGYPVCDSYVSAHAKSGLPMGSLADKKLRKKRIAAHRALTRFQEIGHMTKGQAYQWLQARLDMSDEQMHIGK